MCSFLFVVDLTWETFVCFPLSQVQNIVDGFKLLRKLKRRTRVEAETVSGALPAAAALDMNHLDSWFDSGPAVESKTSSFKDKDVAGSWRGRSQNNQVTAGVETRVAKLTDICTLSMVHAMEMMMHVC